MEEEEKEEEGRRRRRRRKRRGGGGGGGGEEEDADDNKGEFLDGTGYGRWGRVFLFSKSMPSLTQIQCRTVLLLISLDCH